MVRWEKVQFYNGKTHHKAIIASKVLCGISTKARITDVTDGDVDCKRCIETAKMFPPGAFAKSG